MTGDQDGIFSIPVGEGRLKQVEASYTIESATNPKLSYETSLTAQTISVPEPSTLIGLGVLGLLTLRKKSF
ncbi:PEP-CTERM sorting domain-containing protein [Nostoc flagelliforme FACHB-838]|uniref:PEP-CTERM sorting domain-containing protein n=1 Tax=Nostoc flagelliforme FACHB-838 TaxID=2692904 RepID=A0ABR8DRK2_9NOSO|nr:PEP-CTERM sorting domain-containing protein [Nostoc flagelliforme FACHB-838]